MCGTDGLQTHVCIVTQDRKSVRCVLALVSVFLRPRGPPTEVPATASFDACGRILGSLHRIFVATRQCADDDDDVFYLFLHYSTVYECIFQWRLCREVPGSRDFE